MAMGKGSSSALTPCHNFKPQLPTKIAKDEDGIQKQQEARCSFTFFVLIGYINLIKFVELN